jgi:hypothetical protein
VHLSILNLRPGKAAGLPRLCAVTFILGNISQRTLSYDEDTSLGLIIIEFMDREGRSRQFFPEYQAEDFGAPGGLLSHLQSSLRSSSLVLKLRPTVMPITLPMMAPAANSENQWMVTETASPT